MQTRTARTATVDIIIKISQSEKKLEILLCSYRGQNIAVVKNLFSDFVKFIV